MWWRSRIESQIKRLQFLFSIISQAKTNGMEWIIFYTHNCTPFILPIYIIFHLFFIIELQATYISILSRNIINKYNCLSF
jgi:hypothetical protein